MTNVNLNENGKAVAAAAAAAGPVVGGGAHEMPWEELAAAVKRRALQGRDLDKLAELVAAVAPVYLRGANRHKYFRFWEEHGFHLTPVHFYQPVPDTRTLHDDLWSRTSEAVGIDWNEAAQLDLLENAFPRFRAEYDAFPAAPTSRPYEFHFNNGPFDGGDALVLYCMVRHFRPRLVLEVGSGHSTRLSAQAALLNGDTEVVCIEPYPGEVLSKGFPGLSSLIRRKVQDVGLDVFQRLGSGDILFIDSSHVVSCGGDVNYLFLEVLPRLAPGVLVHVHDIHLPREYPRKWVMDLHLFWTEQYLLQAFLTFNSHFEVVFANYFMWLKHVDKLKATFPRSQPWWGGASFWMRRKPGPQARAAEVSK